MGGEGAATKGTMKGNGRARVSEHERRGNQDARRGSGVGRMGRNEVEEKRLREEGRKCDSELT